MCFRWLIKIDIIQFQIKIIIHTQNYKITNMLQCYGCARYLIDFSYRTVLQKKRKNKEKCLISYRNVNFVGLALMSTAAESTDTIST